MSFSLTYMESLLYHSFWRRLPKLHFRNALVGGQSQLLKTIRERTETSFQDGLNGGFDAYALTKRIQTRKISHQIGNAIEEPLLASRFYSHSKHYYTLLLTFQTLHNSIFSYKPYNMINSKIFN